MIWLHDDFRFFVFRYSKKEVSSIFVFRFSIFKKKVSLILVFRFSIFAPFAFLCSNLYYSQRAHCEYHVRSGGSHFHPSTKEKLGKILNIEIQNFRSVYFVTLLWYLSVCHSLCILYVLL